MAGGQYVDEIAQIAGIAGRPGVCSSMRPCVVGFEPISRTSVAPVTSVFDAVVEDQEKDAIPSNRHSARRRMAVVAFWGKGRTARYCSQIGRASAYRLALVIRSARL